MPDYQPPQGWTVSAIQDLISTDGVISDGDWVESKDQDPNGPIRLIQLADIGDGDFRDKSQRFMSEDKAALLNCTFLRKGDVLIARMPDPLGRACLFPDVGQPAVTVVDVCLIRGGSCSALNNRLLKYWINSPNFRGLIAENASGTTRKRITRKKLEKFELPVPPLPEQKVIADKLDTLLAQVENTKARLERIPQILKRLRQSVLAAAVSGRLTEEWRASNSQQPASLLLAEIAKSRSSNLEAEIVAGNKESAKLLKKIEKHYPQLPDSELPTGWQWTTFMSSMEKVVDCHNKTAPYTDIGIPLIRTPDIRDGRILLTDTRFVDSETYEYWSRRCPPQPGDIIFTREAPMGEAGIIPDGVTLCMGQRMMLLRPLSQYVKAEYVLLNILSLSFQQRMTDKAVGTGVKHLRVSDVESLTYPLAPVEEQSEIVHRVDQLFAHADRIEKQVNNALARVNNLTQSILAKAFRGELTEQWRKDNPELISGENSAEALLERVKSERAAQKPAGRQSKTKKSELPST